MSLTTRVLLKIREEMHRQKISQRRMAARLGCSQGRVAKILRGKMHLRLEDLEPLAALVSLPIVELLRDPQRDFYADLNAAEVKIIERVRSLTWEERNALMTMLHIPAEPGPPSNARPTRRKSLRPQASSLHKSSARL